jgi:hypothetical protein
MTQIIDLAARLGNLIMVAIGLKHLWLMGEQP